MKVQWWKNNLNLLCLCKKMFSNSNFNLVTFNLCGFSNFQHVCSGHFSCSVGCLELEITNLALVLVKKVIKFHQHASIAHFSTKIDSSNGVHFFCDFAQKHDFRFEDWMEAIIRRSETGICYLCRFQQWNVHICFLRFKFFLQIT